MPQDRASGAAGRAFGLMMGRGLAKLLGARLLRANGNEVRWKDKIAVIKSCATDTDQIGITVTMLPRLEVILAGFQDDSDHVDVFELDAEKFRAAMYDSRSAAGANLQMVRRRYAEAEGKQIARFSMTEIRREASEA